MDWTTRGKTVLITGAARGLGAETARRVAARGANVALVGLEPEELERVAAQCGANAAWFECDVTDTEALEAAVNGTVERFGGIDVVMANGYGFPRRPIRETTSRLPIPPTANTYRKRHDGVNRTSMAPAWVHTVEEGLVLPEGEWLR